MSLPLLTFISDSTWFRVVAALQSQVRTRNLREISELSGISLGGTSDLLRRLEAAGLISRSIKGRRAIYRLNLGPEESALIEQIAAARIAENLKQRAEVFSAKTKSAIGWADQTRSILKHGKRSRKNTTRPA